MSAVAFTPMNSSSIRGLSVSIEEEDEALEEQRIMEMLLLCRLLVCLAMEEEEQKREGERERKLVAAIFLGRCWIKMAPF